MSLPLNSNEDGSSVNSLAIVGKTEKTESVLQFTPPELTKEVLEKFSKDGEVDTGALSDFVKEITAQGQELSKKIRLSEIAFAVKELNVVTFNELYEGLFELKVPKSTLHDYLMQLCENNVLVFLDGLNPDVERLKVVLKYKGVRAASFYGAKSGFLERHPDILKLVSTSFKQAVNRRKAERASAEKDYEGHKKEQALKIRERHLKNMPLLLKIKHRLWEMFEGQQITVQTIQECGLAFGRDLPFNRARRYFELLKQEQHSIIETILDPLTE